jgi:hypothetical protein
MCRKTGMCCRFHSTHEKNFKDTSSNQARRQEHAMSERGLNNKRKIQPGNENGKQIRHL